MSSVTADLFMTVDLDTGRAIIYERMNSERAVLVKEFPSRKEADAYIQQQLDMDAACDQIHQAYREMAAKWITDKAEETGLERSLVHEWIEQLDLYWNKKEYPADSTNDQRGIEEDPMQEPPAVRIPDYNTPVEPPVAPEAVFPLPPDHECDRQGVSGHYTGEWDYADHSDISYLMVLNAVQRMEHPVGMFRHYLGDKLMQVVEDANLPQELYNDFSRIWRWFIDLQSVEDEIVSRVAARTATNLPSKIGTLDGTLRTALVNAGLCCEKAADAMIASIVGGKGYQQHGA